jgi:hypothetical protein
MHMPLYILNYLRGDPMSKEKIRRNPAILGADLKSVNLLMKDDKEESWSLRHNAKVFTRTFFKYVPPQKQADSHLHNDAFRQAGMK